MNGSTRQLRLDRPVLLSPILGLHRRGGGDPTHRRLGDIWLRATRTPAGPALIKIIGHGDEVAARAWGAGAEWALDQLPRLVGEADDPGGFSPLAEHGPLVEAERRYGHFRVGRSDAVFEALAPACIEQVVTGKEAFRAWRILVREFGEPAPGPASDPDSAAYGMYCRRPRKRGRACRAGDSWPPASSSGAAGPWCVPQSGRRPWNGRWLVRVSRRTGRSAASPASVGGPPPRSGSVPTVTRMRGASVTSTSPRTSPTH